jgi:drug/metabolite transporter (DMT)-like permease
MASASLTATRTSWNPSSIGNGEEPFMLRRTRLRRTIGLVLVIAGALLMLLAPETAFASRAGAGLLLLVTGIVLELVGIALERRDDRPRT